MLSINIIIFSRNFNYNIFHIYLYLGYKGKDVYSVYAIDEHPKDIKEMIDIIV